MTLNLRNFVDFGLRGYNVVTYRTVSLLKTSQERDIPNSTLMEYIKPVVMKTSELDRGDSSILRAFWHSRTIRIPTQASKSLNFESSGLPKIERLRLTL